MASVLERAVAHYAALPRRDISVPEWGDQAGPALITWSALTVRDQERIYAPDGEGRPASGGLVRLRAVMLKSTDTAGNLLFDGMAEHELRHSVSGDVVGRIANAILYGAGLVDDRGDATRVEEQVDTAKKA